jgi:drug/metabolite transporter (DMT)-like permease
MEWILLSLISACLLGVYDLLKKSAVHQNAVPPVLFLNVLTAGTLYGLALLGHKFAPRVGLPTVPLTEIEGQQHILLFCKSMLVGTSWTLAFFALKHLPISIATPIRSTSPLWTTLIAVGFWGESPTRVQWLGIGLLIGAFLLFSLTGRQDGVHFGRNRWVGCMLGATLLGSCSALYDKYLLQTVGLPPLTLQAWFSIYLVPVMFPFAIYWYFKDRTNSAFEWRWSIPLVAIVLLLADILYFTAVSDPQALIAIVSPVRRTSVIIPFVFGILWWGEKNWLPKAICIALMLVGVFLVSRQAN